MVNIYNFVIVLLLFLNFSNNYGMENTQLSIVTRVPEIQKIIALYVYDLSDIQAIIKESNLEQLKYALTFHDSLLTKREKRKLKKLNQRIVQSPYISYEFPDVLLLLAIFGLLQYPYMAVKYSPLQRNTAPQVSYALLPELSCSTDSQTLIYLKYISYLGILVLGICLNKFDYFTKVKSCYNKFKKYQNAKRINTLLEKI